MRRGKKVRDEVRFERLICVKNATLRYNCVMHFMTS